MTAFSSTSGVVFGPEGQISFGLECLFDDLSSPPSADHVEAIGIDFLGLGIKTFRFFGGSIKLVSEKGQHIEFLCRAWLLSEPASNPCTGDGVFLGKQLVNKILATNGFQVLEVEPFEVMLPDPPVDGAAYRIKVLFGVAGQGVASTELQLCGEWK